MGDVFEVSIVHTPGAKYSITSACAYRNLVFVGCDDATLRIFSAEGIGEDGARARTELMLYEAIPKFSKDKRGIRYLHVVPEWGILLSITDGLVQLHPLEHLSKPLVVLPAKSCHSVAASPALGMLAVNLRSGVQIYAWGGATRPTGFVETVAAGSLRAAPADSVSAAGSALKLVHEYTLRPVLPPPALGEGAARPRRNSAAGLLLGALTASAATAAPAVAGVSHVGWVGALLCLGVIRRRDVGLYDEGAEDVALLDLVPDDPPPPAGSSSASSRGAAAVVAADSGYRLSYLLLHPWSGQLLHEVRAGLAPPLDATGCATVMVPGAGDSGVSPPAAVAGAGAVLALAGLPAVGSGVAGQPAPGSLDPRGFAAVLPVAGGAALAAAVGSLVTAGGGGALAMPWGASAVVRDAAAVAGSSAAASSGGSGGAAAAAAGGPVGLPPLTPGRSIGAAAAASARGLRLPRGARAAIAAGGGDDEGFRTAARRLASPRGDDGYGGDRAGIVYNNVRGESDNDEDAEKAAERAPEQQQQLQLDARARCDSVDSLASLASDTDGRRAGGASFVLVAVDPQQAAVTTDGRPAGCRSVGLLVEDAGVYAGGAASLAVAEGSAQQPQRVAFTAQPLALYASPCFPYYVALHADGVDVYNCAPAAAAAAAIPGGGGIGVAAAAAAAGPSQRVNLPHALGLAVCPLEQRCRLAVRACGSGKAAAAAGGDATPEGKAAAAWAAGLPPDTLAALTGLAAAPERVFVYARTGIVMLRMVPVVMQVAAMLSQRPPLFEPALALCEHFKAIKDGLSVLTRARRRALSIASMPPGAAAANAAVDPAAAAASCVSLDALGGVNESKIRQIRAQFGYRLFSRAEFGPSLFHLAQAREPVRRVLSLFPQLLPQGVRPATLFPVHMPVMIDAVLGTAARPLVPYLLAQRRRLRCHTPQPDLSPGDEEELAVEDIVSAVEATAGGSSGSGGGDAGGSAATAFEGGEDDDSGHESGGGRVVGLFRASAAVAVATGVAASGGSTPLAQKSSLREQLGLAEDVEAAAALVSATVAGCSGARWQDRDFPEAAAGSAQSEAAAHAAAVVEAAAGGGGGDVVLPPAVLVDTVLLTAYLWLDALHHAAAAAAAATDDAAASAGVQPSVEAMRAAAHAQGQLRRVRAAQLRLLSEPNCCDVAEAELQLRAFGHTDGAALVALYRGKGLHAKAVAVLQRKLAEATAVLPPSAFNDVLAAALAPAGSRARAAPPPLTPLQAAWLLRLLALTGYVRDLPPPLQAEAGAGAAAAHLQQHRRLLAGVAGELLSGAAAGAVGVLLGLRLLADAAVAAGSRPPLLSLEAAVAVVDGASCHVAHPVLWRVTGDAAASCCTAATGDGDDEEEEEEEDGRGGGPLLRELRRQVSPLVARDDSPPLLVVEVAPGRRLSDDELSPADWEVDGSSGAAKAPAAGSSSRSGASSSSSSALDPPVSACPGGASGWAPVLVAALLQHAALAGAKSLNAAPVASLGDGAAAALGDRLIAAQCACVRMVIDEGFPGSIADGGAAATALCSLLALPAAQAPGLLGHYRRRLLRALRTTPSYDALAALRQLPSAPAATATAAAAAAAAPAAAVSALREERAELLRRLGRHADALRIVVQELRDDAAAQRYCEAAVAGDTAAVAGAGGGGGGIGQQSGARRREISRVFTALLHAHLSPPPAAAPSSRRPPPSRRVATIADPSTAAAEGSGGGSGGGFVGAATPAATPAAAASDDDGGGGDKGATLARLMPFLLRHFGLLDVSQALRELPPGVPLASVLPLLASALHHEAAVARACRTAAQLELVARVQAGHRLQGQQERMRFAVGRESPCFGCGRPLAPAGGALLGDALVCHPSGHVYHLQCSPRAEEPEAAAAAASRGVASRGGGKG